jgi:hypothetical protein
VTVCGRPIAQKPRGFTRVLDCRAWDNRDAPERCFNTNRGLTRSSDLTREGLAIKATQNQSRPQAFTGPTVATQCSIPECDGATKARGWCNRHYLRWWVHGDVLATVLIRGNDKVRFWAKVAQSSRDECWPWLDAVDKDGYGTVWFQGAQHRAPRVAWMLATDSKIPKGQVVRHKCDNPPCVNPRHLELGTTRQNDDDRVARGRSATGDRNGSRLYPERLVRGADNSQYQADGCRNGHAEDRRYVRPSTGERVCRDCVRDRTRRARAKARKEGRRAY